MRKINFYFYYFNHIIKLIKMKTINSIYYMIYDYRLT